MVLAETPVTIATVAWGWEGWGHVCGDKGRWLLPRPPQKGAGVQPKGDACGGPANRGVGAAGSTDSVRAPAAAPGSIPAICLSLRLDRGRGRGAPELPERAPSPRRHVCRTRPRSESLKLQNQPSPSQAGTPGSWGPRFPSAPHHRDSRPSPEAARSQQHPHSHPSHDLKRKKWCHGPQPHFLSLGSPSAPFNL